MAHFSDHKPWMPSLAEPAIGWKWQPRSVILFGRGNDVTKAQPCAHQPCPYFADRKISKQFQLQTAVSLTVILCSVTPRVCSQGSGSWSHNYMCWSSVPGGQHLCKVGCFCLLGRECIILSGASLGCHKLTLRQNFLSPQRPSKAQQSVGSIWKTCSSQSFHARPCLIQSQKLIYWNASCTK